MDTNHTRGVPLLILDLESAPLPDAGRYLDPIPEPAMPALDGRLTDAAKVAADAAKKQAAHVALLADWERAKLAQVNACALNPDLAQIVAVGWDAGDGVFVATQDDAPEGDMIEAVARHIGPATLVVGFNVRFDLAMLQRRALYLGVGFPAFSLDKYRHPRLIDLQDILTFDNYLTTKGRSLDFYRTRFALDVPADPTDGSMVPGWFAARDWDAIREHCRLDILATRALAERLGVMRPQENR